MSPIMKLLLFLFISVFVVAGAKAEWTVLIVLATHVLRQGGVFYRVHYANFLNRCPKCQHISRNHEKTEVRNSPAHASIRMPMVVFLRKGYNTR